MMIDIAYQKIQGYKNRPPTDIQSKYLNEDENGGKRVFK